MRSGHPSTAEGVEEAHSPGADRAVAMPLYPQWSNATTGSALRELRRLWPRERPLVEVCTWHDHPGWVAAAAATLLEAIALVPQSLRGQLTVVFSAHGLPLRQVRRGDPYPGYVECSARETAARCGLGAAEWQVTYQSRVGPMKWLGPDTVEWIRAHAKGRAIVTHPIAFVSEHLETLYDLDILSRKAAEEGGAAYYGRAAAVGSRPDFIAALADIVRGAIAGQRPGRGPGPGPEGAHRERGL
jgi:ferrochelatase